MSSSKLIMMLGVVIFVLGLLLPLMQKLGIGHLPGDINIKKGNFSFFFPITTCIIISIAISVIVRLFK